MPVRVVMFLRSDYRSWIRSDFVFFFTHVSDLRWKRRPRTVRASRKVDFVTVAISAVWTFGVVGNWDREVRRRDWGDFSCPLGQSVLLGPPATGGRG